MRMFERDCVWSFWIDPRFFMNVTAPAEIYTLSLHDALPISLHPAAACTPRGRARALRHARARKNRVRRRNRSEEHTSELQSRENLVCRLLLEKKKRTATRTLHSSP